MSNSSRIPNEPILQYLRIPRQEQMTPTDWVLYRNKKKRNRTRRKQEQFKGKH